MTMTGGLVVQMLIVQTDRNHTNVVVFKNQLIVSLKMGMR